MTSSRKASQPTEVMEPYSWRERYSTPPTNYVGTFVFLSYIFAALLLTFNITTHLYSKWQTHKASLSPTVRRQVKLCTIFALLSFAVLSFNMVSVLTESFFAWHQGTSTARLSLRTWVDTKASGASPISLTELPSLIWDWMVQTPLFDNFARDLMKDWTSRVFTVVSIIQASVNAAEMSVEGHPDGKNNILPQLTQYFLLAQILPPSFSYFLFKIALILHYPDKTHRHNPQSKAAKDTNKAGERRPDDDPILILMLKTLFTMIWGVFHAISLVFILPIVENDLYQQAIWGIRALLISSLLIVPPAFLTLRLGDLVLDKPLDVAQALVLVGGWAAPYVSTRWYPGTDFASFASGLNISNKGLWEAGPAVRALGMDWVVGKVGTALLKKLERKGKFI